MINFRLMKRLFLIRHAKSSWGDPTLRDFDRPLNNRGIRDAPRMGKRLKERRIFPDLMITSPAVRTLETCRIMAFILGYDIKKIQTDQRLYHADETQLLQVVRSIKDFKDTEEVVLLFGHNPGLTGFANSLFTQTIDNIPTCGIVAGQVLVNSWAETEMGDGKWEIFDFPKSKRE